MIIRWLRFHHLSLVKLDKDMTRLLVISSKLERIELFFVFISIWFDIFILCTQHAMLLVQNFFPQYMTWLGYRTTIYLRLGDTPVLARVSNNKIGQREREVFAAASGQKSKPRESQSSVSRFPSKTYSSGWILKEEKRRNIKKMKQSWSFFDFHV